MFEKVTLPDVTDDEGRTVNRLLAELAAKEPRNFLRASCYDGKRAIRQVGTVIPPQYYRLGIMLGWHAKGVDLLARRANLEGFVWPDGDLDSLGLRELMDANQFRSEVNGGLVSSLIHATSYLVNTRGDEAAGEPASLIHVKDARNAIGDWSARRRQLENLLSVTGRDDEGTVTGLALYLDGLTITADKDGGRWSVDRQEHPWGVPAEPLVYKPRAERPFGSSRISRAAMGLLDQALRELIRLEGHMDIYSYPEMWMLGADESIFKDSNGAQKAAWQVMLGRIKGIPDDEDAQTPRADVKQFPASSPQPHLAALNAFAKLYAREMSLPDTALAITDVANPTSAESYDASQYELIAEAEGATDDWSRPLRRCIARGLAIQNGETEVPSEWASIDARWRDPRYQSRAAQADGGMKVLTAAPELAGTEVGYKMLGLTEQQIDVVMAERRRARGSETLSAIKAAVAGASPMTPSGDDAAALKAKADALGSLIRAGASPESAAAMVGLEGLTFTGAVPVSLRLPEADASALEQQ